MAGNAIGLDERMNRAVEAIFQIRTNGISRARSHFEEANTKKRGDDGWMQFHEFRQNRLYWLCFS
jgi:hypothetical protein